jgi:hypothetical protein
MIVFALIVRRTKQYCFMATAEGLFVRLNTPLPASAAVERLFSTAGLVMSHKCARLNDRNFENLVFVRMSVTLLFLKFE